MKKILIFDLTKDLLDRYPKWFAKNLGDLCEYDLISMDEDRFYSCIKDNKWILQYDALVVFGHRLPDLVLGMIFTKHGVPVIYFQHGVFKKRLERDYKSLFLLVLQKGFGYFKVFINGSKYRSYSKVIPDFIALTLAAFFDNKYVGKYIGSAWSDDILCGLVFTEKDKPVFERIFQGKIKKIITIGTPDIIRFGCNDRKYDVLIIAQSLVEDRRMSKEDYLFALKQNMLDLQRDYKKVAIFLHHRSDVAMYYEAGYDKSVIINNSWDIPNAQVYVSDYSSLLTTAMNLGKEVSRIEISKHLLPNGFDDIPLYPKTKKVGSNLSHQVDDNWSEQIMKLL